MSPPDPSFPRRSDQSVTGWIQGLKDGDEEAAARIWQRFFGRVCRLARDRLGNLPRTAVDEEDVALSAMVALCAGAKEERFRRLEDREDLWGVLAMITVRKSIDARRRAIRRSAELPLEKGELEAFASGEGLERLLEEDYLQGLCATSKEMLERLEPRLRAVALMRMEGFTNQEIARRSERSVPTVERHLRMIRQIWSRPPSTRAQN